MDNEFYIAQLRHAYALLVTGNVKDPKAFADGLLAPAIRHFELMEVDRNRLRNMLSQVVENTYFNNSADILTPLDILRSSIKTVLIESENTK
jgi:hypothetical protein